ncbi:MAG: hypothetical protein K9H16_04505 [Bacteroidales bacterium]|nr:hypothetical protein [Bacteroidales bacterium]
MRYYPILFLLILNFCFSACVKKLDIDDLPPMLMVDCNNDGKYMSFNSDNLNSSDYHFGSGIQSNQDDHFVIFQGSASKTISIKNGGSGNISWEISGLPQIGLSVIQQSTGSLSSGQSFVFELKFISPASVQGYGYDDWMYMGETWKWEDYDYYYCSHTLNIQTQDGFFPIKVMFLNN